MENGTERVEGSTAVAEGSSIEELAETSLPDPPEPDPIVGTGAQLTLIAGGEEPTSGTIKFKGGAVPTEGEFEKGETIRFVVEARIAEVHFVDEIDRMGYVLGAERRHVALLEDVRRLPEE